RQPPYQIDLQIITTDANDNKWRKVYDWYYVPAAAGSTGLIVFRDNLPISRDLRIWYKGPHPAVRAYSDVIYEGIHPEWLVAEVVYRALRWRVSRKQGLTEIESQIMNEANVERQIQRNRHPIWTPYLEAQTTE
ncbi:MAG: hypothetical protein ACYSTI_13850, partial [Planctomycetota bacterium]